jgi:branched-chain amino acid transport system substrate-binding protein
MALHTGRIQAGAARWNDPAHFPWTMPLVNLPRSEATVHETYILRTNPNARVAEPYQNDVFGRDYLDGLRARIRAPSTKREARHGRDGRRLLRKSGLTTSQC